MILIYVLLTSATLLKVQADVTFRQLLHTNSEIPLWFWGLTSKENKNSLVYWQENRPCRGSDRLKLRLKLTSLLSRVDKKNLFNLSQGSYNPSNLVLWGLAGLSVISTICWTLKFDTNNNVDLHLGRITAHPSQARAILTYPQSQQRPGPPCQMSAERS